jgi:hypothetical protein
VSRDAEPRCRARRCEVRERIDLSTSQPQNPKSNHAGSSIRAGALIASTGRASRQVAAICAAHIWDELWAAGADADTETGGLAEGSSGTVRKVSE